MKKTFTIIKVGYTAGIYGCSNEYFTAIYTTEKDSFYGLDSISFYGMYGAEERISKAFNKLGYNNNYTPSNYGRLTRKDISKNLFISENEAIEAIQALA